MYFLLFKAFKRLIFSLNIKLLLSVFFIFSITLICFPDNLNTDQTSDEIEFNEEEILSFEADELTIIGTQEKSQDIEIITKEDIEKNNPSDITELLERKGNLTLTRYGTYGNESTIGLRGFGGKRIAILIDGIPVNSVQSGDFDLSKINLSNIEKIEIIKGGSDSNYNVSGAIGGVINIITKKNNKAGFKISGSISNLFYYPDFYYPAGKSDLEDRKFSKWYDFFDTQHATFNFGIGNKYIYWNSDWAGTRAFNHYIYEDDSKIKRRRKNNEVYDSSASTYLTINLPLYMKLILSGDYYFGHKFLPGPLNSIVTGKQIDNMARGSILFDADLVGSDRIDTELMINNNFNNKRWFENIELDPDNPSSIHNVNTLSVINKWGFIITNWFLLKIGGDFSYSYVNSTDLGNIHAFNGGGWTTFEFSIKKTAQIIPSIKLIYYKKYPVPVPKLGFVFYLGENFVLKNNYYRTYRMPSLDDLYWPEQESFSGNLDLLNEDGVGGDIILNYNNNKILYAESSFYVTYLFNSILWQADSSGKWTPENVGQALYIGSDNLIKSNFSKFVKLSINYSFLISFYIDDDITINDDKRMPYNPMHTVGFGAEFNWKTGQINVIGKYTSNRYTTTSNVTILPDYFTMDINFSQDIWIFTIFASIKNTFNTFYYLMDSYPMPGGSVTIGLKVNYEKQFNTKSKQ